MCLSDTYPQEQKVRATTTTNAAGVKATFDIPTIAKVAAITTAPTKFAYDFINIATKDSGFEPRSQPKLTFKGPCDSITD